MGSLGLGGIVVKPTPELIRLQQELIDATTPYSVKTATAAAFYTTPAEPDIEPSVIEYIATSMTKHSGENYSPHVTIGIGTNFSAVLVREVFSRSFGNRRQLGVGAAMLAPAANTGMMNLHLEEISTQIAPGACAVMLCDRAGWHQQGKDLRLPDNVRLQPLPPYSLELNPMENVWDYLRQNQLCSTIWDSSDEIVEACKTAWNWLIADPDRIRSIGNREWATVNV
jgi:hypothetical protein